jgi:hypothetical protein
VKKILSIITAILLLSLSLPTLATSYGRVFCNDPNFSCLKIKKGQSWSSLFPDESQREIVKRLNRTNNSLYPGMVIAVPTNLPEISLIDLSPFPLQIDGTGKKLIVVDPGVLAWGAYDPAGDLVRWGPASAGRNYCSDIDAGCRTVIGKFNVFRKMGSECVSTEFPVEGGGAPMPYCMFFHNGYALHGSSEVPGYNASHGCVRMFTEDAEWLNQVFIDLPGKGRQGTVVVVNPYPY